MSTNTSKYKFNHSMLRVKDPKESRKFYQHLGLSQIQHLSFPESSFDLYFLAYDSPSSASHGHHWTDREGIIELTHNYGTEDDPNYHVANGNTDPGKGFGHVCISVDNIQAKRLILSMPIKLSKRSKITVYLPLHHRNSAMLRLLAATIFSSFVEQNGALYEAARALIEDKNYWQMEESHFRMLNSLILDYNYQQGNLVPLNEAVCPPVEVLKTMFCGLRPPEEVNQPGKSHIRLEVLRKLTRMQKLSFLKPLRLSCTRLYVLDVIEECETNINVSCHRRLTLFAAWEQDKKCRLPHGLEVNKA